MVDNQIQNLVNSFFKTFKNVYTKEKYEDEVKDLAITFINHQQIVENEKCKLEFFILVFYDFNFYVIGHLSLVKFEYLEKENLDKTKKIEAHESEIQSHKSEIQAHKSEIQVHESKIQALEIENKIKNEEIEALKKQINNKIEIYEKSENQLIDIFKNETGELSLFDYISTIRLIIKFLFLFNDSKEIYKKHEYLYVRCKVFCFNPSELDRIYITKEILQLISK